MIVALPGQPHPNSTSDALVESLDLYPTLVEAAGLPQPASRLDGSSLVPIIMGTPLAEGHKFNASFSQFQRGPDNTIGCSMRTDEWRYTEWVSYGKDAGGNPVPLWSELRGVELYDHRNDTENDFDEFENENLAGHAEYAAIQKEQSQLLHSSWNLPPVFAQGDSSRRDSEATGALDRREAAGGGSSADAMGLPTLDELAGTWQATRTCNPSAPKLSLCGAQATSEAQCLDFGCCWEANVSQCYAANDQTVPPSQGVTRYQAHQAVPALSSGLLSLAADSSGDPLGVSCMTAPPYSQACNDGRSSGADGAAFGSGVTVNSVGAALAGQQMQSRWWPYQVRRSTVVTVPSAAGGTVAFNVSSTVRSLYDSMAVLLQLSIAVPDDASTHGVSGDGTDAAPLNVSFSLDSLVRREASAVWGWGVPRPSNIAEFLPKLVGRDAGVAGAQALLTTDTKSTAVSAVAFCGSEKQPTRSMYTVAVPTISVASDGHHALATLTNVAPPSSGNALAVNVVWAIGNVSADVVSRAKSLADSFDTAWAAAQSGWETAWQQAFQPPATSSTTAQTAAAGSSTGRQFAGNFPTLTTADAALRRTYYTGLVSLLVQGRRGEGTEGFTLFPSGGPVSAPSALYIWDSCLNAISWTMLDAPGFEFLLSKLVGIGIHEHYAWDYVSKTSVGPWYAFNDLMIYRCLSTTAALTDPLAFLNTNLTGGSVMQLLDQSGNYWRHLAAQQQQQRQQPQQQPPPAGNRHEAEQLRQRRLRASPTAAAGLVDYGGASNLLECVPTYIHKVPSLNAANVWMMRSLAGLYNCTSEGTSAGGDATASLPWCNSTYADQMVQDASYLSALVRAKLYVPPRGDDGGAGDAATGGGYWACEMPDGSTTEVRHVIDFVTVIPSLLEDMPPEQRAQTVAFVKRELLTPHWMRALSLLDAAAPHSDRKDHGPYGSYDGWLAETLETLSALGLYDDAVGLARAMAPVYDRGPGGQSHQVFGPNNTAMLDLPGKAHADQQYFATSGSVVSSRIISGLFGVSPPLSAADILSGGDDPARFLRDASTPRGFDGVLSHVPIRGAQYTVTSSATTGLSIVLEEAST